MKDLIKYLVDKWQTDEKFKENLVNILWQHACLILKPELAFAIKKPEQLTDEDKKFLEECINLQTSEILHVENEEKVNILASKNRTLILDRTPKSKH